MGRALRRAWQLYWWTGMGRTLGFWTCLRVVLHVRARESAR